MTGLKAAVSFAMTSSEEGTPRIQRGMGVMPVEELQSPSGSLVPICQLEIQGVNMWTRLLFSSPI